MAAVAGLLVFFLLHSSLRCLLVVNLFLLLSLVMGCLVFGGYIKDGRFCSSLLSLFTYLLGLCCLRKETGRRVQREGGESAVRG